MIRHLARRHRVTVATIARSAREAADASPLADICDTLRVATIGPVGAWARFAAYTVTPFPSTFAYFFSPSLMRTVRELLAREAFDAIVVHSSSMGPYVAHHRGCPKLMDFGDADSEKWLDYARTAPFPMSAAFRREGTKVRRWERRLGACFDAASVISEAERAVLATHVERAIQVIPNGVDLDYFAGEPSAYQPSRIVFTGNMSYWPNIDAARYLVTEIVPRVRARVPNVELAIVGMDPAPSVRRLADGARVLVTGRVDDVRPYLRSAAVAVAPMRVGRGLQNKVLEAMAMRVPVVASPAAVRALAVRPDEDVLVAADPERFAAAIARLLGDAALRERYAERARRYVETHHCWDTLLTALDDLVTSTVAVGRA